MLCVKAYPNIGAVPEKVDLVVVCTPAKTVPGIIKDCVKAGVPGAVIISAGFKETGPEGVKLEQQILADARGSGMRIVGPNCLGMMMPNIGLISLIPTPRLAMLFELGRAVSTRGLSHQLEAFLRAVRQGYPSSAPTGKSGSGGICTPATPCPASSTMRQPAWPASSSSPRASRNRPAGVSSTQSREPAGHAHLGPNCLADAQHRSTPHSPPPSPNPATSPFSARAARSAPRCSTGASRKTSGSAASPRWVPCSM